MTLFDYHLLTEVQQIDLIYKQGVYVGKRKEENKTIVLYQVSDFYIEICYRKYRCFISSIDCFATTEKLNPYLEQISINDLLTTVKLS